MSPIPLFDRRRPSLRPDLPIGRAPCADAVQDAAFGTGEAGAKRPGQRQARRYHCPVGMAALSPFARISVRDLSLTNGRKSSPREERGEGAHRGVPHLSDHS